MYFIYVFRFVICRVYVLLFQGHFPSATFIAPEDIALSHEEGFWVPGQNRYLSRTQVRLTHARYSCVKNRYPYFSTSLLQIDAQTRQQLTFEHTRHLWEQLGIEI